MESRNRPSRQKKFPTNIWRPIAGVCICILFIPWFAAGCNDYPLQQLRAQSYTEVTDTRVAQSSPKVDILFVIDNSGSMVEEQAKLQRNFEAFITELVSQDVNDYQIGVITTDMEDPTHSGRLRGNPPIINGQQMSKPQVVQAFTKNAVVGVDGTSYEKALDAMRSALSPQMLAKGGPNEGFLREGAVLAIIFVGDEDDCSNNGSFPEYEYDSDVCRIPNSEVLLDHFTGQPIKDSKGNPVRGQLETMISVETYVDFLKKLNRPIVVSGLIGDPVVYKTDLNDPTKKVLADPLGGCNKDVECFVGNERHRCTHITPAEKRCGGCWSEDTENMIVAPGFRMFELIKRFGSEDNWFPICGNDKDFKDALLRFAGMILDTIQYVPLSKPPLEKESMLVQVINDKGTTLIPQAPPFQVERRCSADSECGQDFVCGPPGDNKCYGEGWVLYPSTPSTPQARLKLSGPNTKKTILPGSKIKVVYVAK
jgi:hypothetical protein